MMAREFVPEEFRPEPSTSGKWVQEFIFDLVFILKIHNEFNESFRASFRPFGSVQNEPAVQNENLDLKRVLTRKSTVWHYAVQMERDRKRISQMAREPEPLPSGWSEMSIADAMHLLHLPTASSVTNAGLREALENALERAKFDEIPVLLGAYRILEGHFGGPEGSATRQDDPTSVSWPAVSAATRFAAAELEAWEDDPSITVSDIRMIEPASLTAPGVTAANSSLQALAAKPEHIVIDDFNLGQLNPQAIGAHRTIPKVVKMQLANSQGTRARRISVPAVMALGIASLLVVWAYHPFAQGLVSSLFGQSPQPTQMAVIEPALAAEVPLAEALTPPNESMPSVVSDEAIMVRAPEIQTPQAGSVNDQLNSNEPNSNEPNSKVKTPKPSASKSTSSKTLLSQSASTKPGSGKPESGKPGSSAASSKAALPKVVSIKPVSIKPVSASTVRKGNLQSKPSVVAARPPTASASRTVQATARKPQMTKPQMTKPRVTKPRVTKPRPVKTQPLIGSQTAKKAIQAVTNAVTQAPRGTAGKPLRASRQVDASRTTKSATNTNSSTKPKSTSSKSTSPNVDTSITNPIKLASSNERDAAAARAIANPQPVASIQTPKASGRIDNLSREEFGQRYFNRKLFEVWQRDGAKLRYGSWDEVPLELQILENNLFRSAIYLNGPGGNEAKDNEKPLQP
jgi:hypothetical protein